MRRDIEIPLAELVVNYLNSVCAVQAGGVLDATICPIVTFYDPMSVDQADRVIITVPHGETYAEQGGNFKALVETYQKTLWTQKTLADDMAKHFARVNEVRDKYFAPNIIDLMSDLPVAGITVGFVNPRMQFNTKTLGERGGWITSETAFELQGYISA